MNSWRLAYNDETQKLTLYYFNATTSTWEIVDSEITGAFDWTFHSLFGRARGTGGLNYYGDMDYVQVIIEEAE